MDDPPSSGVYDITVTLSCAGSAEPPTARLACSHNVGTGSCHQGRIEVLHPSSGVWGSICGHWFWVRAFVCGPPVTTFSRRPLRTGQRQRGEDRLQTARLRSGRHCRTRWAHAHWRQGAAQANSTLQEPNTQHGQRQRSKQHGHHVLRV